MMALTSALTAAILLLPMVVMAQDPDVAIITIRARENATNLYRIGFSENIFNSFHSCVFGSYASCTVSFSGGGCADGTTVCSAVFTRAGQSGSEDNGNSPYYKCTIDQSGTVMNCQKQDKSQLQGAASIDTYTLQSFRPPKCVGLVWTLPGESITFVENLLPVEECGNDCSCTSLVPTPQPATPQPATPQPATPQPATAQPAKPGSATTSTATNIGSLTTQSLRSSKSSGGDEPAPAAVIVGVVLGVIVAALVIVICVFVWIRRK